MKHISFLTLFLFATLFTNAQKFHFGLTAAPALTWLKTDTKGVSNDGSKIGFSYGIVTEFAFNKAENYAFATGLNASYRGGKLGYDDSTNTKLKINLQYIELPITLKMKTNEIGAIKYFGQVGVVPGINIKATSKVTTGNTTVEEDFKKETNPFNLSFLIALGFEYNLIGNTSGFVALSFNNGLLDLTKSKTEKVISNQLALNLGILF